MNSNALSRKSSIRIKKTYCGRISNSVGFSKTDGITKDKEIYLISLMVKGYIVEKTPHGIIITNPKMFKK